MWARLQNIMDIVQYTTVIKGLCVYMYINEASWHSICTQIVVGRSGPESPGPNFYPSPGLPPGRHLNSPKFVLREDKNPRHPARLIKHFLHHKENEESCNRWFGPDRVLVLNITESVKDYMKRQKQLRPQNRQKTSLEHPTCLVTWKNCVQVSWGELVLF